MEPFNELTGYLAMALGFAWASGINLYVVVVGGLWTAFHYPLTFIVFVILSILLLIWLLPRLWRGLTIIFARLRQWFASFCGQTSAQKNPHRNP